VGLIWPAVHRRDGGAADAGLSGQLYRLCHRIWRARYTLRVNPAPHTSDDSFADIDLYCLKCGYNLRGLSGDPRRCPECGAMNPVGEMEVPAEMIRAQLRAMETGPAVCVLAALVGLAVSFGILVALFRFQRLGALNACTGVVLLLLATPLGQFAVIQPLAARVGAQTRNVEGALWLGTAPFCFAAIWIGYGRFYPAVRARMDQLQREVAITVAREALRLQQYEAQE
jgi:hypothetical protein